MAEPNRAEKRALASATRKGKGPGTAPEMPKGLLFKCGLSIMGIYQAWLPSYMINELFAVTLVAGVAGGTLFAVPVIWFLRAAWRFIF